MKIFVKEKRYDVKTGKCTGEELVASCMRCDITGELIEEATPVITLQFGTIDPCFGSFGKESNFVEKYKVNMHEFLVQSYKFKNWDVYASLRSVMSQRCRGMTLDQALRNLRVEAATKLIEEKVIEPWQLLSNEEDSYEDFYEDDK